METADSSPKLNIHISNFDGPLDLLLKLIEVNQMDICDIKIAEITDQYVAYLKEMEEMDLNIASDFLVMATVLIDLKLRVLFPKHSYNPYWEEELMDDPRQMLMEKLLEYKFYKESALILKGQEVSEYKSFSKVKKDEELKKIRRETKLDFPLDTILMTFEELMKQHEEEKDRLRDFHVYTAKITVTEAKEIILTSLLKEKKVLAFKSFAEKRSKIETIILFLAVLELYKGESILIRQKEPYTDFYIEPYKILEEEEEEAWN